MGSIPKLSPIFSALYNPQKIFFQYFSSSTGIYLRKNAKKLKTFYRYHNNSAMVWFQSSIILKWAFHIGYNRVQQFQIDILVILGVQYLM